jgi:type I restriction enzyme S subunit
MIGLPAPKGWLTAPLADVAAIERKSILPEDIEPGTTYLGLEDLDGDRGIVSTQTVAKGDLASNKFLFGPNHILYGKLRPYLRKIVRPDFKGICSTDILPIQARAIEKGYLYHYLRHPRMLDYAVARSEGANLPRLSPAELENWPIHFPPDRVEQKRIAHILDKASTMLGKRRTATSLAGGFLQSAFVALLRQQNARDRGVDTAPLSRYMTFMTSGSRGWAEHYAEDGKRFIRSLDVQMNSIDDTEPCYVNPPVGPEAERTRVKDGDVLVTITGSRVGRVAFVPPGFGEAYVSQHVAIVRLNPEIRPRFVSMYLSLPDGGQLQIRRAQYGQTKPGLSLDQIRKFAIPRVSLAVQDRFCDIWDKHEATQRRLNEACVEAGNLFNSLVQRAFRGEL